MNDRKLMHLTVLAGDCAACGVSPPLQPTMSAIIRALGILGSMSFSELADLIPCSVEALRQQLSRLKGCGLIIKKGEMRGGRDVHVYRLTAAGALMLTGWIAGTEKFLNKIKKIENK